MTKKIKEQFVATVTDASRVSKYLDGYSKPSTDFTEVTIKHSSQIRSINVSIPGDVPLGTQFLITVEQIDEITPAVIQRGTLPHIINSNAPKLNPAVPEDETFNSPGNVD